MVIRTLVAADELAELRARGDVLIVDCRFALADPAQGERGFLAGHIPGAVYASLDCDLSDLSIPDAGRHPLPSAHGFSESLSRWGWYHDLDVVACDDANGALAAARLWWLMRLAGHHRVAVLDGGLAAWRTSGYALETGPSHRDRTAVQLALDSTQVVWAAELQRRRGEGSLVLIDARATPRYRGETESIDPVAGHVPGAVNRPFSENLDANGRFKRATELRAEFDRILGRRSADEAVHMCGSGVTACHNLLAMEHAGLTGSRVFAPSWSGWISDPAHEVATGA